MLRLAVVKLLNVWLLDDDDAAAADALAAVSICFFVACFVNCFADDAAAAAGLDSDDRLESGSAPQCISFPVPSAVISPHSGDDGRDGA